MAPTRRFAVWRVMGQSGRFAHRPLPWSRPQPMHELERVHQVLGHRNGLPVVLAALQRRDPQLPRLEVHVARADPERLGDPAPGHREGSGEGLDDGFRMRARHGEEALALFRGQVLPAARVDEGEGTVGHGPEKATLLHE